MRIISGKFKSRKLFIPLDKKTRPLKDMTKEAIFNTLIHSKKYLFQFEKSLHFHFEKPVKENPVR